MSRDIVARWRVPLNDGDHVVCFEHGTLSGKRALWVDGKVIMQKDWLFSLTGTEIFQIGTAHCVIRIASGARGFGFEYLLTVNGKSFEKFAESQKRALQCWHTYIEGEPYRVALENQTLDIWVNETKVESVGEFTNNGSEMHFSVGGHPATLCLENTGRRGAAIVHTLLIDGTEVKDNPPPAD